MSAAPLRQSRQASHARPSTAGTQAGGAQERRAQLRPVAAPEQARSLLPFMWLCIGIVIAALSAVLLINTTMAEGAYERRDLRIEIAGLHQESQSLQEGIEANGAPMSLAQRARDLGMVPASAQGFVSLSDGIVLENGN